MGQTQSNIPVWPVEEVPLRGEQAMQYGDSKWNSFQPSNLNLEIEKLSFITFNVWFDNICFDQRFDEICRIILHHSPDVVCLQEVLPSFVKKLSNVDWVQKHYIVSDTSGDTVDPYGVMILSRIPLTNLKFHELPTYMSRRALIAEFIIHGETLKVATVHLESLNSGEFRKQQLEIIHKLVSDSPNALIMGDFNFDSERNYHEGTLPLENDSMKEICSNYQDLWSHLRPGEEGKTFDSEINTIIRSKFERMRYDRILFRSTNQKWKASEIQLIGTDPIFVNSVKMFPSDHFGLFAEITLSLPNLE